MLHSGSAADCYRHVGHAMGAAVHTRMGSRGASGTWANQELLLPLVCSDRTLLLLLHSAAAAELGAPAARRTSAEAAPELSMLLMAVMPLLVRASGCTKWRRPMGCLAVTAGTITGCGG